MRTGWPKRRKRSQFWLLFSYVFFCSPCLPYVSWASQEGCLFRLRFSLQSSDLPLFYFRGLLPSLSFSHCRFGLLFPTLPTLQYDITYKRNLKKGYKWTYLQNRNRVTDVGNKQDYQWVRAERTNWECGIDIYILLYINR